MKPEIQTYTGHYVNLLEPDPETIVFKDIAVALSRIPRYSGHTQWPLTVAGHSLCASYLCSDPQWGLLHDAAEAYIGDIPKPLKLLLREVNHIEDMLLKAIAERFGLGPVPEDLHTVDLRLLATEKRDLMVDVGEWSGLQDVEPYKYGELPWNYFNHDAATTRTRFTRRAIQLGIDTGGYLADLEDSH